MARHMMKGMPKRKMPTKESMALGGGGRFAALMEKLRNRKVGATVRGRKAAASRPGGGKIRNPAALAASIGRKKLGKARFQKLAAGGRRRKS